MIWDRCSDGATLFSRSVESLGSTCRAGLAVTLLRDVPSHAAPQVVVRLLRRKVEGSAEGKGGG